MLGIFILGSVLFASSSFFTPPLSRETKHLILPPRNLERMSFGFQEALADGLWLRAIQDFDYCDRPASEKQCRDNSWLYQILDTTTDLSPHFRTAYVFGALNLSVVIGDVEGASKLFEKGIQAFPRDWQLLYKAGYHFLYEAKDFQRAAEVLIQAADNGGPPWLKSLASRLYAESGNTELAESLLQEMIQSGQEPYLIERIREKLESFKKTSQ